MKTLFVVTRTQGQAWDAAKPLGSQQQWSEHAAFMNGLAAEGFILLGGPIGESGDVLLIVNASSEDQIHTKLSGDPWTHSGLLDVRQIQRWTVLLEAGAT